VSVTVVTDIHGERGFDSLRSLNPRCGSLRSLSPRFVFGSLRSLNLRFVFGSLRSLDPPRGPP